jgi:hypothetical protein
MGFTTIWPRATSRVKSVVKTLDILPEGRCKGADPAEVDAVR